MEAIILPVSVVAANYNNGSYLDDFIGSILNASALPQELIIVDDGSNDNSREILDKYKDLPIARFIYFDKNQGFANALNRGIETAASEYIMRADPDDILHPDKICLQYAYLSQHPNLAGIGCNVQYFRKSTATLKFTSNFPLDPNHIAKSYKNGEHGMQHPTVMLRSSIFKKYKYIQDNVPAEDYDIFARMIKDGNLFENLSAILYFMRIHPHSASSRLKAGTINKTFALRREIFGITTNPILIQFYYRHMRHYRNFLLEDNPLKSYLQLFLSLLYRPSKLFKRLKR